MIDEQAGKLLLVDKEVGWTSFDVVKRLRGQLREKKVGHAGTLDPLATGLLIVCTGKKTKTIDQLMGLEKEYTGTMVIGKTRPSVDLETEIDSETAIDHLQEADVMEAAKAFNGEIMQTPPLFSAIRIDGKRAYEHARKGEDVKLAARPVVIYDLEVTQINLPLVEFRIVCSKGFYIRSWVRDFGLKLGVGAYMQGLRRTRIGSYKIEDAATVDEIVQLYKTGSTDIL
ncbi:MAG: tRNA pseudouridine(55) synthase TruB [Cyclobacteriaceae bacterium]